MTDILGDKTQTEREASSQQTQYTGRQTKRQIGIQRENTI